MQLYELTRQGEPQAGAFLRLSNTAVTLLKSVEDARLILRCDAHTRVSHRNLQPRIHPASVHVDMPAVRSEFHCIGEQVEDHLLDLTLVGLDYLQTRVRLDVQLDAMLVGPLA